MDDIYWSWYTIAFILEIISIIIAFSEKYSIKAKNFSKVWLYYSLTQWNFIEWNKPWFFSNFFWIIFRLLINPFFSWIMVLIRWYWFISLINKKISTPEKLKEINYKLWASLLNEEEVKKLIKESASFIWKDIIFEEEEDNTLILKSTDDWRYAEISLDTKENKIYSYSHTPDYDSEFNDIFEYKIEWTKVFNRTIEQKITHPWEEYYDVKDWVILESDIIKRAKSNIFIDPEEKIKELKQAIEWSENQNYKVKYFILSKYSNITNEELRKFLRWELERVKLWFMKISDFCKDYDIELLYNDEDKYYQFKYKSEAKNDNINYTDFSNKLETAFLDAECKRFEIENYNEILDNINSYLWKEKND